MATCPVCEVQFALNPSRPAQQYCRRVCTERAKARRRRAPGVAARRAEREAARQAKASQLPPATKTCAECGGQYVGRRHRYCSEPCSKLAARRKNLVRYGKTPDEVDRCRKCGVCVPMGRKSCDSCLAVAVQNERQRARRRRKARQRGAVSEPYTLPKLPPGIVTVAASAANPSPWLGSSCHIRKRRPSTMCCHLPWEGMTYAPMSSSRTSYAIRPRAQVAASSSSR